MKHPLNSRVVFVAVVSIFVMILGVVFYYTPVLARIVRTDKTLPWTNLQHNVMASGTLGVFCDPNDPKDTRVGCVIRAVANQKCSTVNVLNEVDFRMSGISVQTFI